MIEDRAAMIRASLGLLNPLRFNSRPFRPSTLPIHESSRHKDGTESEKYCQSDGESSGEYEYSYPSSPESGSARSSFDSHPSDQPMIRKKPPAVSYRYAYYRMPRKIVNRMCFVLIITLVIFIGFLARMSYLSSKNLQRHGEQRPSPPKQWESFDFLTRYYGGIRTILPLSENTPEYPREEDEQPHSNATAHRSTTRSEFVSKVFQAYPDYKSESYLSEYLPVQECFLDTKSIIRIPPLQYYEGRPRGFPDNIMGAYELLGVPNDICFDRYGRLGPYGHGYGVRLGGLGSGLSGDSEGSEAIWHDIPHADYRSVDWSAAQGRCYDANAARFLSESPFSLSAVTLSLNAVLDGEETSLETRSNVTEIIPPEMQSVDHGSETFSTKTGGSKKLSRTAVVVRTWDSYEYHEEDILYLRSLISELSLGSGAEYDVHLLVQVKDEAVPVWADADAHENHLRKSVPEEFWGMATLWSETQMRMLYQGLFSHDTFPKGPELRVHGVYRGLMQAFQYFAHNHPEYEFFWHLEMDFRSTGHYYDLFSKFDSWSKEQPRKGLWERNSRFYVPLAHGSWEDFKQMVRVQTESGTDSPNNIWSSLDAVKKASKGPTADKSIWGPERADDPNDWFEISDDPVPPTTYAKDKYEWGVGEDADLITLNPIFDPDGTTWGLAKDITGYNNTSGLPPRRAAIITTSRMSKRLLNTMHRETAFARHHAFSEMWAPTTALHHGYKAVYIPHPVYIDRDWPTAYLAATMNGGRNGASGGARTSVFGEREHNLLGTTFYYNAGFAGNLWRRWLGLKVDNEGGEIFETQYREEDFEKLGKTGVPGMRGGEGRMCLPPMVLHPVKGVELPVESIHLEDIDVMESDPSA
jgi:hypothetical protein